MMIVRRLRLLGRRKTHQQSVLTTGPVVLKSTLDGPRVGLDMMLSVIIIEQHVLIY
jgi:hypothetical protein